jgi:hypothetical protein
VLLAVSPFAVSSRAVLPAFYQERSAGDVPILVRLLSQGVPVLESMTRIVGGSGFIWGPVDLTPKGSASAEALRRAYLALRSGRSDHHNRAFGLLCAQPFLIKFPDARFGDRLEKRPALRDPPFGDAASEELAQAVRGNSRTIPKHHAS